MLTVAKISVNAMRSPAGTDISSITNAVRRAQVDDAGDRRTDRASGRLNGFVRDCVAPPRRSRSRRSACLRSSSSACRACRTFAVRDRASAVGSRLSRACLRPARPCARVSSAPRRRVCAASALVWTLLTIHAVLPSFSILRTVAPLKISAPACCARTSKLTSSEFLAPKLQPVAQSPQRTHLLRLTLPELVEFFIATVIAAGRNLPVGAIALNRLELLRHAVNMIVDCVANAVDAGTEQIARAIEIRCPRSTSS